MEKSLSCSRPPTPETIKSPSELRGLSIEELRTFADQVRAFLIENISKTGGHIGANLGTVDLTVALHHVFDSPKDTIIFDTGHQGYTHKIITGRARLFPSLNTLGGMSRFLTTAESEHDPIEASHAGTSVSMGLGIAIAKKLRGDDSMTVVVIGDGSLAEGLAQEGLNHASVEDVNLLVIINVNGFAISPGFGFLHELLMSMPKVDGHNMSALLDALFMQRRGVMYVNTEKGHGWSPAALHPARAHFLFPFDPKTGIERKRDSRPTYPDVIAKVIEDQMERNDRIVCITPSTLYATGLGKVFERWPKRCFDPGMEEQHALTMAAGMALQGMLPVIAYQSTFFQRAFDQLIHDVCYHNRPVLILLYRSGFAGYDSPTHHGIYDVGYLRAIPNLRVIAPSCRESAELFVHNAISGPRGPTAILMPYGHAEEPFEAFQGTAAEDIQFYHYASGSAAAGVASHFSERGYSVGRVPILSLSPLVLYPIRKHPRRAVLIEEQALSGVGDALAVKLGMPVLSCSLPPKFIEPGSREELSRRYGIDAEGVIMRIENAYPEYSPK